MVKAIKFLVVLFVTLSCSDSGYSADLNDIFKDEVQSVRFENQHWWYDLAGREVAATQGSTGVADSTVDQKEAEIFSVYLEFLNEVGVMLASEELRLQRVEASGNQESGEVIFGVCPTNLYSQWNELLPDSLNLPATSFETVYCSLECLPPGADHATYEPSSESCRNEATRIHEIYHSCDAQIGLWEALGFGSPNPGSSGVGPVSYGAPSLAVAMRDRDLRCKIAQNDLQTVNFEDNPLPGTSIPNENPEIYSTYEKPELWAVTQLDAAEPTHSNCMIAAPTMIYNRVEKLREAYRSILDGAIYSSFAKYPIFSHVESFQDQRGRLIERLVIDENFRREITRTTDAFFEGIFNQYDSSLGVRECLDVQAGGNGEPKVTPLQINFRAGVTSFIDDLGSLAFGGMGTIGGQREEIMGQIEKLERLGDTPLTLEQSNQLKLLLESYKAEIAQGADPAYIGSQYLGNLLAALTPAGLSKAAGFLESGMSSGLVNRAMQKLSTIFMKPFPLGSESGAFTKGIRVLQSGGHIFEQRTADVLNQELGKNLPKREWGKALENLKKSYGLGNDHHGKILSNGDYADSTGRIIDNLSEYFF